MRWYSEGVPYGQLVVVRDGRIVREFFHDLQDPSHKVPSRNLTFVVLANTDELSSPYPLGAGRLDSSPWARAFLGSFVFGTARLP